MIPLCRMLVTFSGISAATAALCLVILVALIPLDMRLLRKRVFGEA